MGQTGFVPTSTTVPSGLICSALLMVASSTGLPTAAEMAWPAGISTRATNEQRGKVTTASWVAATEQWAAAVASVRLGGLFAEGKSANSRGWARSPAMRSWVAGGTG